jgi:Holliday junction resolvase-like predicted endonuclease
MPLSTHPLIFYEFVMFAERSVLVLLLKLTKEGATELDLICQEANVSPQIVKGVLKKHANLITYEPQSGSVSASSKQRLRLVLKMIGQGADIERVSDSLTWLEFEDLSIMAFKANDYETKKHFRFKWADRRWEIDILAQKEPLIVCADCKQWHRGWSGSGSRKAAEMQSERAKKLSEATKSLGDKLGIKDWRHAQFIPMVLSLAPGNQKFFNGVPIVPVLQLRDFLISMPAYLDQISSFRTNS